MSCWASEHIEMFIFMLCFYAFISRRHDLMDSMHAGKETYFVLCHYIIEIKLLIDNQTSVAYQKHDF